MTVLPVDAEAATASAEVSKADVIKANMSKASRANKVARERNEAQVAREQAAKLRLNPAGSDVALLSPRGPSLKLAALHFDMQRAIAQDGMWRQQQLHTRSPRLQAIEPRAASTSEGLAALQGKSDVDIVQMLLENDLSTATFVEYLQQTAHGSPTLLIPWLQTLAALASKVGMLLESTRFLNCDLQLARLLLHITASAKALSGAKRAHAWVVNSTSDLLYKVGDRGEVLQDSTESLSKGTSFAAHCARSSKPLLIGLPGSPTRNLLQFNVDSGTGCRPEACVCVPCLDHLGNTLAVLQVIDRQSGGSFGRDDVVLLQRFAVQCGVSLRNAGGVLYSSAAPVGDIVSPRTRGARQPVTQRTPQPPDGAARAPRKPKTSDASLQCDLLEAPPLELLAPSGAPPAATEAVAAVE